MVYFILFATIAIIALVYYVLSDDINDKNFHFSLGVTFGIGLVLSIMWFVLSWSNFIPNAKDVVKGNTTLQITYVDSVPIDTIVVFKKDYKPKLKWW